jgi:hypothetical protein
LIIASQKGHVECIRTLLGGGALINQPMVRTAGSMARRRGACVLASVGACVRACVYNWLVVLAWCALARGDRAHAVLQVMGSIAIIGCSRHINAGMRPGIRVCCFRCECRVAWQTNGVTPLCIASQSGHVECVHALLDGGAAINQATVGFEISVARLDRGCVCGGMRGRLRASFLVAVWVR